MTIKLNFTEYMNYIIGQGAVKSRFCQMVGQTTVVVFKLLTKVLVSAFNLVNMDVNSNQFLNHDVTYNQMLSVSTLPHHLTMSIF